MTREFGTRSEIATIGSLACLACAPEQFHETRFVRVAQGTSAIRLDPFRVLAPEVIVNLFAKFGVRPGLVVTARGIRRRLKRGAQGFF